MASVFDPRGINVPGAQQQDKKRKKKVTFRDLVKQGLGTASNAPAPPASTDNMLVPGVGVVPMTGATAPAAQEEPAATTSLAGNMPVGAQSPNLAGQTGTAVQQYGAQQDLSVDPGTAPAGSMVIPGGGVTSLAGAPAVNTDPIAPATSPLAGAAAGTPDFTGQTGTTAQGVGHAQDLSVDPAETYTIDVGGVGLEGAPGSLDAEGTGDTITIPAPTEEIVPEEPLVDEGLDEEPVYEDEPEDWEASTEELLAELEGEADVEAEEDAQAAADEEAIYDEEAADELPVDEEVVADAAADTTELEDPGAFDYIESLTPEERSRAEWEQAYQDLLGQHEKGREGLFNQSYADEALAMRRAANLGTDLGAGASGAMGAAAAQIGLGGMQQRQQALQGWQQRGMELGEKRTERLAQEAEADRQRRAEMGQLETKIAADRERVATDQNFRREMLDKKAGLELRMADIERQFEQAMAEGDHQRTLELQRMIDAANKEMAYIEGVFGADIETLKYAEGSGMGSRYV